MSAVRLTHRIAAFAGAGTAAIGLISLIAWASGAGLLTGVRDGYIPMAPLTALLFVVLGSALAADTLWPRSRFATSLARIAVVTTWTVAGLTLAQISWSVLLPWDGWLVTSEIAKAAPTAGRVSPLTAIVFMLSAPLMLRPRPGHRWTTLLYPLAFAGTGLSLLVSLVVIVSYAAGAPLLYGVGAVPMALLTGATFALFNAGLLLSRMSGVVRREWRTSHEGAAAGDLPRLRFRYVLGASLGLATAVAILGFYYLRDRQAAARIATVDQLEAVVTLKAREIVTWRQERISEARFLARTPTVAEDLVSILGNTQDQTPRARLLGLLDTIRGGDRYESIAVFTPDARLLLNLPEATPLGPLAPPEALKAALSAKDVVFSDIHAEPGTREHLELLAPIRAPREPSRTIAVIVLRVDPTSLLFPTIANWPLNSATAESFLVRRVGDEVENLTDVRYLPPGVRRSRRSVNDPVLPAALAFTGRMGTREGRDYRGVPVVFAARPIPGSTWMLMAKVDQAEAYAPARREAWLAGGLVAVLLLMLAQAALFIWRQRQADILRRALAAEQEHRSVSERLALVTRHANDVVLLFDQTGRIVEANDRCLTVYGRSPEEMCGLTAADLRPATERRLAEGAFASVLASDGTVFETTHCRADASIFPVEVSARPATILGARYILSIIRDITERRSQEKEIERLTRLYSALSQVNEAIVRSNERDVLLAEVCRSLVEAGGFELAWVGWRDPQSHQVYAAAVFGDRTGYLESLEIGRDGSALGRGATGTALRESRIVVRNDFLNDPGTEPWRQAAVRAGIRASISLPIRPLGETVAALNVYARHEGFFREKEIALLKEAAVDIAFGLENLDREAKRLAADASLHASLREKEALLKEVHHRVKNNLQIILSLLRLESSRAREASTSLVLRDMQGRIHSMALLHQTLYRTGDFARIDLADYLTQIATQVSRTYGADPARVLTDFTPVPLGLDHAIPCGLIVTELLTNSLKYAFPGEVPGTIRIALTRSADDEIVLEVSDTGVGLPADFESRSSRSLGLQLVSDLARQLGGRFEIPPPSGQGATFRVAFPAPQLGGAMGSFERNTG